MSISFGPTPTKPLKKTPLPKSYYQPQSVLSYGAPDTIAFGFPSKSAQEAVLFVGDDLISWLRLVVDDTNFMFTNGKLSNFTFAQVKDVYEKALKDPEANPNHYRSDTPLQSNLLQLIRRFLQNQNLPQSLNEIRPEDLADNDSKERAKALLNNVLERPTVATQGPWTNDKIQVAVEKAVKIIDSQYNEKLTGRSSNQDIKGYINQFLLRTAKVSGSSGNVSDQSGAPAKTTELDNYPTFFKENASDRTNNTLTAEKATAYLKWFSETYTPTGFGGAFDSGTRDTYILAVKQNITLLNPNYTPKTKFKPEGGVDKWKQFAADFLTAAAESAKAANEASGNGADTNKRIFKETIGGNTFKLVLSDNGDATLFVKGPDDSSQSRYFNTLVHDGRGWVQKRIHAVAGSLIASASPEEDKWKEFCKLINSKTGVQPIISLFNNITDVDASVIDKAKRMFIFNQFQIFDSTAPEGETGQKQKTEIPKWNVKELNKFKTLETMVAFLNSEKALSDGYKNIILEHLPDIATDPKFKDWDGRLSFAYKGSAEPRPMVQIVEYNSIREHFLHKPSVSTAYYLAIEQIIATDGKVTVSTTFDDQEFKQEYTSIFQDQLIEIIFNLLNTIQIAVETKQKNTNNAAKVCSFKGITTIQELENLLRIENQALVDNLRVVESNYNALWSAIGPIANKTVALTDEATKNILSAYVKLKAPTAPESAASGSTTLGYNQAQVDAMVKRSHAADTATAAVDQLQRIADALHAGKVSVTDQPGLQRLQATMGELQTLMDDLQISQNGMGLSKPTEVALDNMIYMFNRFV